MRVTLRTYGINSPHAAIGILHTDPAGARLDLDTGQTLLNGRAVNTVARPRVDCMACQKLCDRQFDRAAAIVLGTKDKRGR